MPKSIFLKLSKLNTLTIINQNDFPIALIIIHDIYINLIITFSITSNIPIEKNVFIPAYIF
jgi:hypothetical protein